MVSKYLGPRYVQLLRHWTPTLATWSVAGMIGVTWFADWQDVLRFVPWIGGKYKKD
ncbi:hypothetical protein JRQ81_008746 [Phrynocephalus forsythii]|uniref:Cytochrome b-c1 complex subunit 10 n=1 Tax=Phrynocephalus forsythii TaxID=171643 RepID=A0A9Q1ASZ2_9SAUR|nr:hypothetical protein JRQ81_008746 [Phrynocephalus forsythii]